MKITTTTTSPELIHSLLKHVVIPVLLAIFINTTAYAEAPIKPRGLKPGDTIAIVAPSGESEADGASIKRAKVILEKLGYKVLIPKDITRRRGYLAGTDERRAAELMAAFTNPNVQAIFPVTGGYGTTRILDKLDYETIAKHPKVFIGFSDITGLHLALTQKCNFITFHAPNIEWGLGRKNGLPAIHQKYLWHNILAKYNQPDSPALVYVSPKGAPPIQTLRSGKATGRLAGGNLSLIAALMGTPYEIETEGKILFLEDISEAPYRIDRMLSQLRLAGKLKSPAAVVLGQYYKCTADEGDASLTLDQVFDDYFAKAPYPVIKNFPAGHGPWNFAVPLNARVEVDADKKTMTVLEKTVLAE